jgi:hypothetical protein
MSVAVLGASGGVGRSAVRRLRALGIRPLRVGARSLSVARTVRAEDLDGEGDAMAVDLHDEAQLAAFCHGTRIVLNCAGPSLRIGDRVARAALGAGADYVDAGGDEARHARLTGQVPPGARALVSAGVQPGLSGLLVRALAEAAQGELELVAHGGGLGHFTPSAAVDYLAGLGTAGTAQAAWRDGAVVGAALAARTDVAVDGFPGRVRVQPFLTHELVRVAAALGLRAAEWWTVFDGERVACALRRRTEPAELMAAAAIDAFGRAAYQQFTLVMHGSERSAVATLRGREPVALTGDIAALAVAAVDAGAVAPGLGFAGETLDVDAVLAGLRDSENVESLAVSAYAPDADADAGGLLVEGSV